MKISREDTANTRKSLLAAASEVFADKGYRDATIAAICERAGTNIAAVNYHFSDKESLYREAWRYTFLESIRAHPTDGGVSEDESAERRLIGRVVALLRRAADENSRDFLIVHKEIANPTGLLEEVMRKELRPLHERTEVLVREILGPIAPEMKVRFCAISIVSQCISPVIMSRMREAAGNDKDDPLKIGNIEAYADHVVKFSLAGIHAIRLESEES